MSSSLDFSVLTLFPEMFDALKKEGVVARAIQKNIISIDSVNLRDFSDHPRRNVDERSASSADGMVIKPDIAEKAILSLKKDDSYIVHLTPTGKILNHALSKKLAKKSHIILLCGRYAGFDYRVIEKYADLNLSLGDFVLSGGELPAMCLIDSVVRFVPGVLGNEQSALSDSFENGLLEAPQYTKPRDFHGEKIPDVLLSGDHKKIEIFQRKEQLRITAQNRSDLIMQHWDKLTASEKVFVEKIWKTHGS